VGDDDSHARQMIALGATIINYSSDAAVLRSSDASIAEEIPRSAPANR